jgi:predicted DNA-binding transcriptional regulator AlpA
METQNAPRTFRSQSRLEFFGGTRPLNPATLYRGIRKGRFPRPIKVGPGSNRWLRSECESALQGLIEGRAGR